MGVRAGSTQSQPGQRLVRLIVLAGVLALPHLVRSQTTSREANRLHDHIGQNDREWLRGATVAQLEGCRIKAHDGTILFAPDGSGHYQALWTRDFTYMLEQAGDLIDPKQARAAIQYLLRGQRADGCMPDRVTAEGKAVYSPGGETSPLADHALDNGPFMAKLVAEYVRRTGDVQFFSRHEAGLRKGLDFVRRADNGLVYNDPDRPQCPYGFTDTVAKTGHLLFTSLLYYDACRKLCDLSERTGTGDSAVYAGRADLIGRNVAILWDGPSNMFLAADRDCRQVDVWGSALAVHLGVASPAQSDAIIRYLVANRDKLFKRGQVRHLPKPKTWSRLLIPIAPGTYQNGAYWATPHAWLLPILARKYPDLVAELLEATLRDFRSHGINECINDGYRNVPDYVVSATSVYSVCKGS